MNHLMRAPALSLAVMLLLTGCVVFPVTTAEDAEQKAVVGVAVEATVEAAIALAVEATISAMDATSDGSGQNAAEDTGEPAAESDAPGQAEEVAAADNAAPMLITPTPDRSGEIAEFIIANTRHFRGDPNAPVVLIEFSDFMV